MSIAGQLQSLFDLGPRPPWWHPIRRRRWDEMFHALGLAALFDPAPPPTIQ